MSVESRERFAGLVTNAAGPVAPNGALDEAENVVVRKPGAIEPRDGLRPADGMDGSEIWGLVHQKRDLVMRYNGIEVRYFDLLGTEITYKGGLPPMPMRRDILTYAQARGNLYLPTERGVVRLVEGSGEWQDAGLVNVNVAGAFALTDGPPAPHFLTGTTMFSGTTFMDLPAGQGSVPAATFWVAAHVYLRSIPPALESNVVFARGRGAGVAVSGYQLQIFSNSWHFVWWLGGASFSVTRPILPSDAGRTFVVVCGYTGGSGTIWVNGVQGTVLAGAAPTADATDVMTFGNSHPNGPQPLQGGVLLSVASGTSAMTTPLAVQAFDLTRANGDLVVPAAATPTRQWKFSTLPPTPVLGGQVAATTGPGPSFLDVTALYPGDVLPEEYPPEFWLPAGYHAGYRLVGVDRDANGGLVRRSAPSDVREVINPASAAGAAAYVTLEVFTTRPGVAPYEEVEIYRTRAWPLNVALDDEMQLVGTVPTPVPPATATFVDKVPDGARGVTLYTSLSRGGILQQNEPPPACACIALFKGSLFFANTRGPARLVMSFTTQPGDLEGQARGIGQRVVTGTTTNGSNVVTGVSSTAGIQPGMSCDGPGVSNARVQSVGAGTVTLFTAAGVGAGAGTLVFADLIWIGSTSIAPGAIASADNLFPPDITVTQIVPPLAGYAETWVLTSDTRSGDPSVLTDYTVRATHGDEYSPALPLFNETEKAWDQDVWPGGIMWSKTDEPEHVAPINYAFVGDHKKACLGLVPTRDALFILKEDGVFRLTGVNAVWRIDPYDPTLFCCLPMSVAPLQEQAYFLSNKGVIAFSDGGSEMISGPINDQVKPVIDQVYNVFRTTGFYELPGVVGSVAAVYERENEYTLMRGKGVPAWVYNRNTTSWVAVYPHSSEYTLRNVFTAVFAGRVVYVRRTDSGSPEAPRAAHWTWLSTDVSLAGLARPRFDDERLVTIDAATGGPFPTVSLLTDVAVLADDAVVDGAGHAWIVAHASTGASVQLLPQRTALGAFTTPTAGPGWVFRTIRATVTPTPFDTPPPRPKHWRALSTAFAEFDGPLTLRYAYASAESPRVVVPWDEEDADVARSPEGLIVYPMGYAYAGLVPHAHARAWSLRGSVRWAMYQGFVSLEGIYVEATALEIGRQQKALP
jgi:hypothetical protein